MLCKENIDTKGNIRSSYYIQLHLSVCITHPLLKENSGNFKEVCGEIVALIFYSNLLKRRPILPSPAPMTNKYGRHLLIVFCGFFC
jgi:hypothetical protein